MLLLFEQALSSAYVDFLRLEVMLVTEDDMFLVLEFDCVRPSFFGFSTYWDVVGVRNRRFELIVRIIRN